MLPGDGMDSSNIVGIFGTHHADWFDLVIAGVGAVQQARHLVEVHVAAQGALEIQFQLSGIKREFRHGDYFHRRWQECHNQYQAGDCRLIGRQMLNINQPSAK